MKNTRPPSPRAAGRLFAGLAPPALAVLVSLATTPPAAAAETFKVIVNARVAGGTVPKATLADIYLGRVKRWRDGRPIAPVDQPSTSPLRSAFSAAILEMTLPAVRAHWMQRLTAGERPPVARPNDADVIEYVSSQPGAIGYVALETPLPDTVKAVAIEGATAAADGPGAHAQEGPAGQ